MSEKMAFTVQEAAAAYGVSTDTIRANIKAGNLIARYPTSRPVIGADELQDWFEALPTEP
ncbi:hypothetical protein ACIGB6_14940 [Paeniglutamicibacter gangotriensis]|uniref:hypothetical protein n=1 Tax=Paeniglutamicibacter gangotriensis TaxID=254787 RepID=UPI0037CA7119